VPVANVREIARITPKGRARHVGYEVPKLEPISTDDKQGNGVPKISK
jgi:hypothetical protein